MARSVDYISGLYFVLCAGFFVVIRFLIILQYTKLNCKITMEGKNKLTTKLESVSATLPKSSFTFADIYPCILKISSMKVYTLFISKYKQFVSFHTKTLKFVSLNHKDLQYKNSQSFVLHSGSSTLLPTFGDH